MDEKKKLVALSNKATYHYNKYLEYANRLCELDELEADKLNEYLTEQGGC